MAVDPGKLRVLLVDDSAERRRLLRTLLSSVGIREVVIAGNAAEALASLGRQNLDLMLVDHDLEGGRAIAFVRELRGGWDSPAPELPVILVASADRSTILAARDAGVTEFLARPASTAALLARLEEIVDRPRPFVRVDKYVGPCRRRRRLEQWAGVERRGRGAPRAPKPGPEGEGRG
jgi:CheY-like chemotaxis protein